MMPAYVYSDNYIHAAEGWLNNINSSPGNILISGVLSVSTKIIKATKDIIKTIK